VLHDPTELVQFIKDRAPLNTAKARPKLEYVFPYLAGIHVRYGGIQKAPWARRFEAGSISNLADAVKETVDGLAIDLSILTRNPGISPFALDELLQEFREHKGDLMELLPADPASDDAVAAYAEIFGRMSARACPNLGQNSRRWAMLAMLVTRWMRGFPLALLIQDRLNYLKKAHREINVASEIRAVMTDVEQVARFEAPRALSAYCDVLRQHLRERQREDIAKQVPEFRLFLELGVNQKTQISLMGIGLSRSSAIAVSDLITADSLSQRQALVWLRQNTEQWSGAPLPVLVKKEIERVVAQNPTRTGGSRKRV
jgi:hypothetical protein